MNSESLRNRITFQIKVDATKPVADLDDYKDYKTIWAKVNFLRGRDFYSSRASNIKTEVEFIVRYRNDLDETMRIKFDNEFYNIEGILPVDNRKTFLVIRAYNIKHSL